MIHKSFSLCQCEDDAVCAHHHRGRLSAAASLMLKSSVSLCVVVLVIERCTWLRFNEQ